MAVFLACSILYHRLDIHRKFGIFQKPEPNIHFRTAMLNWKVPLLWGIGITLMRYMLGMPDLFDAQLAYIVPEQLVFLHSYNWQSDLLYSIAGFYTVDFIDYWMHRWHHSSNILFSKFPFAHFVHHNCVYLNPTSVASSPLFHLTALGGFVMHAFLLSQGLWKPLLIIFCVRTVSNLTSHLGCDPLPWLSKLNHKVGGWIPWIPLHHQYHHLPYVKDGNYGNFTCLWDYVFGTVIPESVYHIENSKPLPKVMDRMERGDEVMTKFLKGKTAFNI